MYLAKYYYHLVQKKERNEISANLEIEHINTARVFSVGANRSRHKFGRPIITIDDVNHHIEKCWIAWIVG